MRPNSYQNFYCKCCDTCKHCDYNEDFQSHLCLYGDDQDNLDDLVNYTGQDKLAFLDARQVSNAGLCERYEEQKWKKQ